MSAPPSGTLASLMDRCACRGVVGSRSLVSTPRLLTSPVRLGDGRPPESRSLLNLVPSDRRVNRLPSRGDEMAKVANAPLLARIPLDPALAPLCDRGRIEDYDSDTVATLGENLLEAIGELGH